MDLHKAISLLPIIAVSAAFPLAAGETPKSGRSHDKAAHTELKMSITAVPAEKARGASLFLVTLQNTGDQDVLLNLGMMLANGKVHMPDAIRLVLREPNGRSRELHFSDRRYPGVAGRIDDYAVPLRAGSAYTVELNLDDYWCSQTKEFRLKLTPQEYRVHAELTAKGAQHFNSDTEGMELMNFWKGELRSNTVEFQIGAEG
jgi:hypothetical protein